MDTAQTDQGLFEKELPIFLSEWLGNGLNAIKVNEQTGEKVPDYKVRLEFHRILGKLLGF